jgi:hypothetical protein
VQLFGLVQNVLDTKYYLYGTFSPTSSIAFLQAPRVRAIREATTLPLLLQGSGVCVSPSERFGIDDELLDDQVNENANG